MGRGRGARQSSNQSASNAQGGSGGDFIDRIEGSCIGIGVGVSFGGIGLGMNVGFTPQGNGCSSTDLGIGSIDIVQVGCDVIVTKTLAGVVIEVEHRTANDCKKPEPPAPPTSPNNSTPPTWDIESIRGQTIWFFGEYSVCNSTSDPNFWKTYPPALRPYGAEGWGGASLRGQACPPYKACVIWGYSQGFTANTKATQAQFNAFLANCYGATSNAITYVGSSSFLEGCVQSERKTVSRTFTPSSPPSPSGPPPPNLFPPKKMSDCCNATTSMLRKIMKVLAVEEIDRNGIKIQKEFLAPGGTGQLKVDNYAELLLNLFRTVNRYGIDTPIVVKLKDVNKAKAGDQGVEMQFNSPAAAIQGLLELAVENKGDAATRLQIQVRLAYAVTRTLKIVAGIGETIREVMKMLGSPFKWTTIRLPLEFDLTAGATSDQAQKDKGFGKKPVPKESEDTLAPGLEAKDEDTTESMLPAILTPSDYPLPVPRFVQTEDDLQDLLMKVILLLGKKK